MIKLLFYSNKEEYSIVINHSEWSSWESITIPILHLNLLGSIEFHEWRCSFAYLQNENLSIWVRRMNVLIGFLDSLLSSNFSHIRVKEEIKLSSSKKLKCEPILVDDDTYLESNYTKFPK